ncbi:hypothetical protein [uncultured Thiodictyon sp.]|uniref:hypothetical protein n=1 Tax=uncultured Thiodictyon sp. TaxID=1846217 RepID=UPI0025F00C64|nr:hypothetical protein [uncultured Thiodictyon sp.]
MKAIKPRIEALEAQADPAQSVLLVIGEPTPERQAAIDSGRVRVAVHIPDNGRDNLRGNNEQADSTTH